MGEEILKESVWYNGKTVNQDGNNPRYVGGIVKFIDVDPNTKVKAFLCTVRDIFGIPEAVPITMNYHIFFSSEISKLLDITPYGSLKFVLQPGLMLHSFYVEENVVKDITDTISNVVKDVTDTISNMPRCRRSARISNIVQSPPTVVEFPVKPSARGHVDGSLNHEQNSIEAPALNPIPKRHSNKRSATDRDDSIKPIIVDDHVKRTSSANSSQMVIFIKSLCGLTKTLKVERAETVGSIRERICKIEGIPVNEQRLSYGGKQLGEDHRTLADLGIESESTIPVLLCLRGC
ncbi:hypothetical protein MKW92_048173 [Papaver armeniacum]|nr:hypothetical protein MKW92_048173 [Papaver armeniacum]